MALGVQHAMRMSSVACPAQLHFSTLRHKWHDYRRKNLLNVQKCVLFSVQLWPETFLVLRIILRGIITKVHSSPWNGSVVGIATSYRLHGPGIESQWGRDFPYLSWGPPSHLYNGYRFASMPVQGYNLPFLLLLHRSPRNP